MSKNDRYVVSHGDDWAVKKGGAKRASSIHGTQREAEQAAKNAVRNLGGGEVRMQGESGRWRDSTHSRRGIASTENAPQALEQIYWRSSI